MAFKATRKPPAAKKAPEKEPQESIRIEDLVGTSAVVDEQVAAVETPKAVVQPTPSVDAFVQPPQSSPTAQGEQGRYQPRGRYYGGGNGGGPHASGSYDRGGMSGGQSGYDRGGNSGYRRGVRRDFGGSYNRPAQDVTQRYGDAGNTFVPDINVPTQTVKGMLDVMPEGHGFLRPKFTPSDRDIYISQSQIRRFLLRNGDAVEGQARPPKDNERYWGLLKVEKINDAPADQMASRPRFEDLVPLYPNKLLILETGQHPLSTRIIDLVAPIGFGQRGLVVSPPKAGKTTILKEIAAGITANFPNVHLMAALIGERPEEVTDISRSVKGEVLASNFDESPSEQTRIAEVALERAKRLVEMGKDVVILLDSITRLARAYNLVVNPSGRTLSGGFDPAALYPAKKFLGAARCVEPYNGESTGGLVGRNDDGTPTVASSSAAGQVTGGTSNVPAAFDSGGSLTVIGTALVETGSRMDDLIYEEFKGTGNMELHLSRALQERRIFPAIDVGKSGTRHDELLLGEEKMKKVTTLRHMLTMLGDEERTLMLIDRLSKTKSNEEFLESLSKGA